MSAMQSEYYTFNMSQCGGFTLRAYPQTKRMDVLAAYDAGTKTDAVAKEFGVSRSWARGVKQRRAEPPRTLGRRIRRRTPRWAVHESEIQALVRADPEITILELKKALNTELSVPTLCRALRRLGLGTYRTERASDREWIDESGDLMSKLPEPAASIFRGPLWPF